MPKQRTRPHKEHGFVQGKPYDQPAILKHKRAKIAAIRAAKTQPQNSDNATTKFSLPRFLITCLLGLISIFWITVAIFLAVIVGII